MASKLLISLVSLVAALLAAEVGHRVLLAADGRSFDRAVELEELEKLIDAADGSYAGRRPGKADAMAPVRHPFLGFDSTLATERLEEDLAFQRQLDQWRASGKDGEGESFEVYRILVLGGSVAAGFGHAGRRVLEKELAAAPELDGRWVRVLGYGVAGFKQPQQLNLLAWLLALGLQPEAVLCLDGFNEVALGNVNHSRGYHPVYPAASQWTMVASDWYSDTHALGLAEQLAARQEELRRASRAAKDSPLLHSSLGSRLLLGRLRRSLASVRALQEQFERHTDRLEHGPGLSGPPVTGDSAAAIRSSVRYWVESSLSIQALCEARGIDYLHVLQPTLHDGGERRLPDGSSGLGDASAEWLEAVEVGYPLLRQGGEVLGRQGVAFHDMTGVFGEEPEARYVDACHYDREGNLILAEAIARAFLELLEEGR